MPYRELLRACRSGGTVDGGGRRGVDADAIRRCCTADAARVDPRGLHLRHLRVRGTLDLAGTEIGFPVRFHGCTFDAAPVLENARLPALTITDSPALPGLLANGVQIRGDLDLSRSAVSGAHRTSASTSKRSAIWLCESQIGGRLLCVDTTIVAGGERAIQADRMRVGGTVRLLRGFTATAEVRMIGARIDGTLDLTGATLGGPGGLALDLGEVEVGGSLFLIPEPVTGRPPAITGRIDLGNGRIGGQMLVRDAIVTALSPVPVAGPYGPNRTVGTAVNAPRLSVGGDLALQGACRFEGGVDLALSDLGSLTVEGSCRFDAPDRRALDLTNAELRSNLTMSPGVTVRGELRFTGMRVHGNLSLRGVRLSRPRGGSLVSGSGAAIDGDLRLEQMSATGGYVRFRNAVIKGAVDAGGAVLDNPGGPSLSLHQCLIGGSVRLVDGFRSTGYVLLNRSTVDGRLDCRGGVFHCPGPSMRNPAGHAIEAISATVRGGLYLGWAEVSPSVDLTNVSTPILADDPDHWPQRFVVSGLTYDRFEHPGGTGTPIDWDSAKRGRWLLGQAAYDSGPYEQLAAVFRRHGYTADAEEILIDQRHAARRAVPARTRPLRYVLDLAYGLTVGYGFRPSRVLWLLMALLIAVTVSLHQSVARDTMRATDERGNVYAADGRLVTVDAAPVPAPQPTAEPVSESARHPRADACGEGQVRCFSPALYAIDTVVPLISLGQRSTWYANARTPHGGAVEWWLHIATLAGWLLSTIFLLSLARPSRSG
ncbi:hypothetical protein CLV70_102222 [Pseudosporangium ferrugineum]|uniref:Oxidoreductase n=1 Tax=Pseudosporangium ferrugineum TaxID=439699 RepID=A0A2T0SF38_9ACTN|nr:hypothetical protein CLV70_102222 [Pseudosporangium ferrugineum]